LLRAKGVTLSATAIATGLTAEMAKAAPLKLAASASAALTVTNSTPTYLAMTLSKPKILIPATLLVCAIPLVIQQQAISSAEKRRTELLGIHTEIPARASTPERSRNLPPSSKIQLPADFNALRDAWDEIRRVNSSHFIGGGSNPRAEAYAANLESFDTATLIRLIREGASERHFHLKRDETLRTLVFTLAKRDPRLALDTMLGNLPNPPTESLKRIRISPIIGHWAALDPGAADRWFREAKGSGKLAAFSDPRAPLSMDPALPLFDSLITSSPALARRMIEDLPADQRTTFLGYFPGTGRNMKTSLRFENTGGGAAPTMTLDYSLNLLQLMREFAPGVPAKQMNMLVLQLSGDEVRAFVAKADLSNDERMAAARHFVDGYRKDGETWKADLVEQLAPGHFKLLLDDIKAEERQQASMAAEMQLTMMRENPAADDAFLSQILTLFDFRTHTAAALEQANRIKDPEKRRKVIEKLQRKP
jgi:hypothetical protein